MKTICIYHANCFDGMAAAWVVKRKFPDCELIPANYGVPIYDYLKETLVNWANPYDGFVEPTRIIIVDFSFPREQMAVIASISQIIVLDHHKTAQANCEGLSFCKFDMNQSGAGLTWRYFFPNESIPALVEYIEDRDLWRFRLNGSKLVNSFIQSYPINIENYEMLFNFLENHLGIAMQIGEGIERYKDTMVKAICKHARLALIGDHWVPTVQSGILFNEIGHYLASHEFDYPDPSGHPDDKYKVLPPFAASWFIREDGVKVYSLRSIGNFDVSEVARQYGGGGHKNAAGFQIKEDMK